MRILYLNLSLPDHRVEKAAYIAKKNGHTIFYAGDIKKNYKPSKVFGSELFKEYFKISFSAKNNLGFNLKPLIKKLKEIHKEFDFDIIHANNIYCANLASKLDIPFVFDDHEYFSQGGDGSQRIGGDRRTVMQQEDKSRGMSHSPGWLPMVAVMRQMH